MSETISKGNELRGIDGWLVVLIFYLWVFVPFAVVTSQYSDMVGTERFYAHFTNSAQWQLMKNIRWSAALAQVAIMMLTGWLLYARRRARTPYFAIAGIWLGTLGVAVVAMLVTNTLIVDEGVKLYGFGKPQEFMVGSVLITAYLLKSKRVKHTYYDRDPSPSAVPVATSA